MAAVTSAELQEAWEKVKRAKSLPNPPTIKLPLFSAKTPMKTRLAAIQHVISTLEYNYTGTLYFDVTKNRSFKSIVSTAKDILNEVLPIQCLEAVFLGAYLTASAPELERFPISFKTVAGGCVHRHIVLAVRHQHAKWGALGLSRSEKLMAKELKYASLSELVQDFCREFALLFHAVLKVYAGFPFSHDIHSSEKVEWRVMNLPLEHATWADAAQHLDAFSKEALDILAFKRAKGELPDSFALKFPLHVPETEPGKKSPDKRVLLSAGSFEFPGACGDEDAVLPLEGDAGPEKDSDKPPKPILVAPDRLEFKQALANAAQVLPTNIFLQNTTTSPYFVDIEELSGQLEIVTRGAVSSHHESGDSGGNNAAPKPSTATFRVSAKGMTAVAIKFRAAMPAAHSTVPKSDPAVATKAPGKTPRAGKGAPTSAKSFTSAALESRQVVTFKCRRVTRSSEGPSIEVEDGEAFVTELPFVVLPTAQ
ncbi:hypothetical protein PybrP1_008533 [[Pythium] brassicae (nom. inval.)]|nr:hypothetical protein PybrP1_008533 [[Pythium] brassicae (nom. inval.)]